MIQRSAGGTLVTFRVQERIDRPGVGRFVAERLPDHRSAYLDYEGPVSGGRGTVRRVAAGELEVVRDDPDTFECRGQLGEVRGAAFRGARGAEGWEFRVELEATDRPR